MRFSISIFAVLFSFSLSAQTDIFEVYAEMSKTKVLPTDIKKITDFEYGVFRMDEEAKPDTVFKYLDNETELFQTIKMETLYESAEKYVEINYDASRETVMTSTYVLDEKGRALSWETDMGDSPAAAFMNSKKEYLYDENGRISSILNNGKEQLSMKYDDAGNFSEILMEMGMMKMKVLASNVGEKIRYDMSLDAESIPEGMPEMMLKGIKDSPKAYIEQTSGKDKNIFIGFEENKETGEFEKRWETVRDLQYILLSKKEFSPEGEIMTHNEYSYTESGEIKSSKDLINESEVINEFNEAGNMVIEREAFAEKHHSYDEKGNLIRTITLMNNGEEASLMAATIRKIEYK